MIFDNSNIIDENSIEIDESVSEGMTGAYETMLWIEEENRKFMQECVSLDVQEVVLGENTEAFNESAGEWVKGRLTALKEFVKKVFGKIVGFLKKALEKIKGLFSKKNNDNTKSKTTKLEDIPDSEAVTGDRYIEVTDKKYVSGLLNDVAVQLADEGRKVANYALQNVSKASSNTIGDGLSFYKDIQSKSELIKGFDGSNATDLNNYFKNQGAITEKSKFTAAEAKAFTKDSGENYVKAINDIIGKANQSSKSLTSAIDKMNSKNIQKSVTGIINEYSSRVTKGCNLLASVCGQYIKMINKEITAKRAMINKLISQYNSK